MGVSDLTWNADQRVAFVSKGERADQCCVRQLGSDVLRIQGRVRTMEGTAVIVNVLSG